MGVSGGLALMLKMKYNLFKELLAYLWLGGALPALNEGALLRVSPARISKLKQSSFESLQIRFTVTGVDTLKVLV